MTASTPAPTLTDAAARDLARVHLAARGYAFDSIIDEVVDHYRAGTTPDSDTVVDRIVRYAVDGLRERDTA